MGNERIDLPQGTLDLLILKTLALEAQHGWAISERIQQISSNVDQSTVGRLGEQPPRQVLRPHANGTEALGG
jgi:PadR family transcriptional regulator, regulatory protein PadR